MSWPDPCPGCGQTKGNKGAHNGHVKACTRVWTLQDLLEFGGVVMEEGTCWLWQKYPNSRYPYYTGGLAHRKVYELVHGDIPKNFVVCHSCDVPRCVNPAHLRVDTQKENIREGVTKGHFSAPKHYSAEGLAKRRRAHPRGDNHWTRKNPEAGALWVRAMSEGRARARLQKGVMP